MSGDRVEVVNGNAGNSSDNNIDKKIVKDEVGLVEVVKSIRIIKAFVDFRDKMNELLLAFAQAGVDISRVNFNDPMSMVRAFSQLNRSNVDVDVDTILDELQNSEDITFKEVKRAHLVLSKYIAVSNRIDSLLKRASRSKPVGMNELESVMSMFNLPGAKKKVESSEDSEVEEEETEITEEDLEELKKVVQKYKQKKR